MEAPGIDPGAVVTKTKPKKWIGAKARIVNPVFVRRVGYPREICDYLPEVDKHDAALVEFLDKILSREVKAGGPELIGDIITIEGIRRAVTGEYYPPTKSIYDPWNGDYDGGEPGGLANSVHHRLAAFEPAWHGWWRDELKWIEVSNLELIG